MRLAHLELVTIAGLGATIVHTAFAVVTRPDGVTPGAALIGGLADVVVVAEAALVAVTVAARAITIAVRADPDIGWGRPSFLDPPAAACSAGRVSWSVRPGGVPALDRAGCLWP